jgi:hypothetical protein
LSKNVIFSPGCPEPSEVVWLRPEDVMRSSGDSNGEEIGMFDKEMSHSNDVV